MKKNRIIILLLIILVVCLAFFSIKYIKDKEKNENKSEEVIEIFEKMVGFQVFLDSSVEDTDEIKSKLENLEYVKSVNLNTKEEAMEEMKTKYPELMDNTGPNIFTDSFIIKLEINNVKDMEEVSTLEKNIDNINGIKKISSNYDEFMRVYKRAVIDGLREYDKVMEIMDEQGIDGVNQYFKDHEDLRQILKWY